MSGSRSGAGFGLALAMVATGASAEENMRLTSPTLADGGKLAAQHVLNRFGCEGPNRSPALQWSGAPKGTQSFAITLFDPDAPTGSGWWHWIVFDLPATATGLLEGEENLAPPAIESRTDFGAPGYGGACPPSGEPPHRYIFTLYALDTPSLGLDREASGAMVGYSLHQHALATATLTVHYGR